MPLLSEWGEEMEFSCACVAETVLLLLLLSLLIYCVHCCCGEFHALAVHPRPTFTAPPIRSAFGIRSEVCGGVFLRKQSTC